MKHQVLEVEPFELHNTDVLGEAFEAWKEADAKICSLIQEENSIETVSEVDTSEFLETEAALSALQAQQHSLIKTLTNSPAMNMDDVLKKLTVWKSIVCPGDDALTELTPADAIIMSVFNDIVGQQRA